MMPGHCSARRLLHGHSDRQYQQWSSRQVHSRSHRDRRHRAHREYLVIGLPPRAQGLVEALLLMPTAADMEIIDTF